MYFNTFSCCNLLYPFAFCCISFYLAMPISISLYLTALFLMPPLIFLCNIHFFLLSLNRYP